MKFVEVVNCFDLKQTVDTLERAIRFPGPSFVVSRGLCAILAQRERRQRSEKIVPYVVDLSECTDCRLCINSLGCPAIVIENEKVCDRSVSMRWMRALLPGLPQRSDKR